MLLSVHEFMVNVVMYNNICVNFMLKKNKSFRLNQKNNKQGDYEMCLFCLISRCT